MCSQKTGQNVSEANQDSFVLLGTKAHEKGIDRIGNPFVGVSARAWAYGWNKGHGKCEGCEGCLAGTEEMPELFSQYMKGWRKMNAESLMPVVFIEASSG